jgi:hypothetical protein
VAGARLWVKQLTLGDQSPYSSDDFSTTTNRHGDFTVSGLRAGRYTIHVAPPRGSQYLAPYAEAEIQATASDHEITLRLARGGMVHGKVLDRETGSGLSGVTIEHERRIPGHDGLADSVWEKIQAQTGAGGVFCMTLPSGKFDVSIVRPVLGYATPLPKTVDVRAGLPIEEVLFSLDHGRVIAGQVLDPEGIPIKGVRVDALWDESEHPRTVTDSNGQFVMAGDSFSALRFIHYERRLGALIREKDLFAQKSDLKIRLRALGRVRGTIVDDDHHPIPGALVQLNYNKEDGSGTVANVLVGLDGKFEFASMVFSCPHELEAWANGYTRFHRELGIVENGQIQELQEIRLHKIDSLDRRVHDR